LRGPSHGREQLNADIAEALNDPEIREKLPPLGATAWPASPAELTKQVNADIRQYGDINKKLKISLD
jgi:tripartite-type tricarboxylate transporter receptor subunit TctC